MILEGNQLKAWHIADTTHDPAGACRELLGCEHFDRLAATGYGRGLAELQFDAPTVTEIKAYAVGARHFFPRCRTILDIGGQDTKVIGLDEAGRVHRFEMNDRCAAGTGRFLEVMAQALKYNLDELGREALAAKTEAGINSMCTVFAESEVVSLLTKGAAREAVARGLHTAIVDRTTAMLHRVSATEPIVFAGGGALNACLRAMLGTRLKTHFDVPENPQIVGAMGAALIAKSGAVSTPRR